jgi:hypothetical protein
MNVKKYRVRGFPQPLQENIRIIIQLDYGLFISYLFSLLVIFLSFYALIGIVEINYIQVTKSSCVFAVFYLNDICHSLIACYCTPCWENVVS